VVVLNPAAVHAQGGNYTAPDPDIPIPLGQDHVEEGGLFIPGGEALLWERKGSRTKAEGSKGEPREGTWKNEEGTQSQKTRVPLHWEKVSSFGIWGNDDASIWVERAITPEGKVLTRTVTGPPSVPVDEPILFKSPEEISLEELDSFPTVKSRPHLITEPAGEDRPTEVVVSEGSFLGGPRVVAFLYWPRMIPGWVMFMDAEGLIPSRPDPRDWYFSAPVLDCDSSFTRSISFPKVSLTRIVSSSIMFMDADEMYSWAKRLPWRGILDCDSSFTGLPANPQHDPPGKGRDFLEGKSLSGRIPSPGIFGHPWLKADPLPPHPGFQIIF
jgi:hypothetical protein